MTARPVDELLVTTRLQVAGPPDVEAYGLVPIDGDGPAWRAVAVVRRVLDVAEVLALVAVEPGHGARLLDGVADELRATGCACLRAAGSDDIAL